MRRRPILLSGLALFAFLMAAGWLWWHPPAPEPLYRGKPLTYWLEGALNFDGAPGESPDRTIDRAKEAVLGAGTNAIPTLLRLLRDKHWLYKQKALGLAYRLNLASAPHQAQSPPQLQADFGFQILGPRASAALPALLKIYDENLSPMPRERLVSVIGHLGPAARVAIPRILDQWRSTNFDAELRAIRALADIHAQPNLVVPVLVSALTNSDQQMRFAALFGLRNFGSGARAAVPALLPLLRDPDLSVGIDAEETLKCIDLDAAERSGLEVYRLFSGIDFPNPASFARKLTLRFDAISIYLYGRLSETARRDVALWSGSTQYSWAPESFLRELNEIIKGPSIYDAQRFATVGFRPETQTLLAANPRGAGLTRLNRLLIEDAYPREIQFMRNHHPPTNY